MQIRNLAVNQLKPFVYVFFMVFTICSCVNDHYNPALVRQTVSTDVDTNHVCFGTDVFPIIQSNCAISGCHDATSRAGRIYLTEYKIIVENVSPGDGLNSVLYITTGNQGLEIMPPLPYNPLTTTQRLIIKKWIDQGATEKTNCR